MAGGGVVGGCGGGGGRGQEDNVPAGVLLLPGNNIKKLSIILN